ncbi:hypothetical protein ACYRFS_00300 [Listeria kieliensis]
MFTVENLKTFLGEEKYYIRESSEGIEVRTKAKGIVDQENGYFLKEEKSIFNLFRISRDSRYKILMLQNMGLAIFYLGVRAKLSNINYPQIGDIHNIQEAEEVLNSNGLESYSLLSLSPSSVCLYQKGSMFIVSYVNENNKEFLISDDNPTFTLGVRVLANYTLIYDSFKKYIKICDIDIDYNSKDYDTVIRDLFDIEE